MNNECTVGALVCFVWNFRKKKLHMKSKKLNYKILQHKQKSWIYSYIRNWLLQSRSQNYDLISHTTYTVCANFICVYEWLNLQFKVDSERQIFEKLFISILFTLRIFARNLLIEEVTEEIFFLYRFDIWSEVLTVALRLISLLTTY